MPSGPDGRADRPRRRASVLRGFAVVIGVLLGGAAAWLVVTGKTQKRIEVGVLVGLWGVLIAACAMFGTRHRNGTPVAGHELEVRPSGAVERAADAATQREYEYRLEQMLRRQIQAVLAAEVESLRAEVASLRSELVEKVGGQIQLERIEITRVIGSDIEALQREVRQLKSARVPFELPHAAVEPARPEPAAPETLVSGPVVSETVLSGPVVSEKLLSDAVVSDAVLSRPVVSGPVVASDGSASELADPRTAAPKRADAVATPPAASYRNGSGRDVVEPSPRPPPLTAFVPPAPIAPAVPPTGVTPAPSTVPPSTVPPDAPDAPVPADPFAALPRLTRFTDFELDPVPATPEPAGAPAAPSVAVDDSADAAGSPAEQGVEEHGVEKPGVEEHGVEKQAAAQGPNGGRHAVGDSTHAGRRRRAPGQGNDVLARLLEREGVG